MLDAECKIFPKSVLCHCVSMCIIMIHVFFNNDFLFVKVSFVLNMRIFKIIKGMLH